MLLVVPTMLMPGKAAQRVRQDKKQLELANRIISCFTNDGVTFVRIDAGVNEPLQCCQKPGQAAKAHRMLDSPERGLRLFLRHHTRFFGHSRWWSCLHCLAPSLWACELKRRCSLAGVNFAGQASI